MLKFLDSDDPDVEATEVGLKRIKIQLDAPRSFEIVRALADSEAIRLLVADDVENSFFSADGRSVQIRHLPTVNFRLSGSDFHFRINEYDANKVKSLRSTLISAMARYGHRMTQVADDERILVVVNGPHAGQNDSVRWSSRNDTLSRFHATSPHDGDQILFSFDKGDLHQATSAEVLEKKVKEVTSF